MRYAFLLSAAALVPSIYSVAVPEVTVAESKIPQIPGMNLVWSDQFPGSKVDETKWTFANGIAKNKEQQIYGREDCHVSGGILKILPKRMADGQWTSCRLETKPSWEPRAGSVTYAAKIKLGKKGAGGNMKGVWPAFWTLCETYKASESAWPTGGEVDTMENVNGDNQLHGTAHCGPECKDFVATGSFEGKGNAIPFDRSEWNVYSHTVAQDKITWYLNGKQYFQITKAEIPGSWANFQKKFYVILNVAMGGTWPGDTAPDTVQGAAAGMEVQYVAVYQNK